MNEPLPVPGSEPSDPDLLLWLADLMDEIPNSFAADGLRVTLGDLAVWAVRLRECRNEWEAERTGHARVVERLATTRLLAFQAQQSAVAVQAHPEKANAVSASWVIEVAGRILASLPAPHE